MVFSLCPFCPSQQLVSCAAHSEVLLILSPQFHVPLAPGNGTYSPMSPGQASEPLDQLSHVAHVCTRPCLQKSCVPSRVRCSLQEDLRGAPDLCSGFRSLLDKGPQPVTGRQGSTVDGPSGSPPGGQRLEVPPFIGAHTPGYYEVVCCMNTL